MTNGRVEESSICAGFNRHHQPQNDEAKIEYCFHSHNTAGFFEPRNCIGPFGSWLPETAQIHSEKQSSNDQNTNFTPSWMSRGLFLCVVTIPKVAALLGSRPMPLPK